MCNGMRTLAGAQKADQVFLPVLENAMKAQKLRTTLGVFDRSKFFFNLPSSLVECIEAVSLFTHEGAAGSFIAVMAHIGSLRGSHARLPEG